MNEQELLATIKELKEALSIKEETIKNLKNDLKYDRDNLKYRIKMLEMSLSDRNKIIKELREEKDRLNRELEYNIYVIKLFKQYLEKDVKMAFTFYMKEIINEED